MATGLPMTAGALEDALESKVCRRDQLRVAARHRPFDDPGEHGERRNVQLATSLLATSDVSTQNLELSMTEARAGSEPLARSWGKVRSSIVGPAGRKQADAAGDRAARAHGQEVDRAQPVILIPFLAGGDRDIPFQSRPENSGA